MSRTTIAIAIALVTFGTASAARADTITRPNIPLDQAELCINDVTSAGYRLASVGAVVRNNTVYYTFVFETAQEGLDSPWVLHWKDADWRVKAGDMRALGYRLTSHASYIHGGQVYRCGVWVK